MSDARATHPMSGAATDGANNDFYAAHPEMVTPDGHRKPIDPHNKKLRDQWLLAYAKHGGKVRNPTPAMKAAHVRQAGKEAKAMPPNAVAPPSVMPCSGNGSAGGTHLKTVASAPRQEKFAEDCLLVDAACACEHGRVAGENGVLYVVPEQHAFGGDEIKCISSSMGGCHHHIRWTVDGADTLSVHAPKTSFGASAVMPSMIGFMGLHKIDPRVYRANATACRGGAPSFEIRAYPPEKLEAQFNFKKLREAIKKGFELAPIDEEEKNKFEFLEIQISCAEQWKEDKKSPRAYCECEIAGGALPLIKTPELSFQIYPPNLLPEKLRDYIKFGVFVSIGGEISFSVAWIGKYWPDTSKWQHDKVEAKLEAEVELKLAVKASLLSKDVLDFEIAGKTSFTGEAKAAYGEPAVEAEVKWGGLEAVITIHIAWRIFEHQTTYPILKERTLWKHEYPFHGEKKEGEESPKEE